MAVHHFISGLPRSGSTLLSAILSQNPRIWASVTSPVSMLWGTLLPKMGPSGEFDTFFDDARRARILRSLTEGYYGHESRHVIIDTHRHWTARLPLLNSVYPDARVICCVRSVSEIIDSIERILRKNPLLTSRVFKFQPGVSVYARAETLMNSDAGLIGLPWSTLREAWFSEFSSKLIIIEYDRLCRDPGSVIASLYRHLGEPPFKHDYENIDFDQPSYDEDLGMPGLHKVRPRVEFNKPRPVIPPDILAKYAEADFWRRHAHDRGVISL